MRTQLIGINGKIGAGKDTVGEIIQKLCLTNNGPEFEIKKFAGKLKQIASLLTGINISDFEYQDFKNTYLDENWDYWCVVVEDNGKVSFVSQKFATHDQAAIEALALEKNLGTFRMKYVIEQRRMTVRQLLQELGTEAMRDGLHTNVWVNALFADFKFAKMSQYNPSHWLITDMRFPNELEAIKERGGITIRVTRDYALRGGPEDPKNLHPSETALDKETFDYEIVNDGTIEELVGKVRDILIKEEIIRDGNI
ncbi:MAG: hypothetical protein E6R13_00145 [Spirochaetes bacterium]|nr:MAG: hypothetical protein E6R13_00145 [Spirochaetota bacterium]